MTTNEICTLEIWVKPDREPLTFPLPFETVEMGPRGWMRLLFRATEAELRKSFPWIPWRSEM